jgi:hypothetical protein
MPVKHLQGVRTKSPTEKKAATAAQELLQTLHSVCVQASSRGVATLATYTTAVEANAATDISDEDVESAWQQLDAAELAHESAEEEVAAAEAEFEAMVKMTNQIDGLVVRVVDTNVHVHKVVVQIADISKDMLRDLLGDVCEGFHRAGLLQKLIPS